MFAKYVGAVRIGRRGKAPVGRARIVRGADRLPCRITAVWQRDPISGQLELRWRSAAETAVDLIYPNRWAA